MTEELFTSTKSINNIRLYERSGYKIFKQKRYLKNCNLCIYKNVEIQDRRKEISNAWGKI